MINLCLIHKKTYSSIGYIIQHCYNEHCNSNNNSNNDASCYLISLVACFCCLLISFTEYSDLAFCINISNKTNAIVVRKHEELLFCVVVPLVHYKNIKVHTSLFIKFPNQGWYCLLVLVLGYSSIGRITKSFSIISDYKFVWYKILHFLRINGTEVSI